MSKEILGIMRNSNPYAKKGGGSPSMPSLTGSRSLMKGGKMEASNITFSKYGGEDSFIEMMNEGEQDADGEGSFV